MSELYSTNFTMSNSNLSMVRGDTLSFGLQIEGLDGTLDEACFTCKKNLNGEVIFQKSIDDGIVDAGDGKYIVRVAPEDTAGVDPGKYFYDLEIRENGDVFTIMHGILSIEYDVTSNVVIPDPPEGYEIATDAEVEAMLDEVFAED